MKAKPFYEVLEEQIRSDLRKEIEAEVRSQFAEELRKSGNSPQDSSTKATAFDRLETWLASHVSPQTFSHNHRVRQTYGSSSSTRRTSETKTAAQASETSTPIRPMEPVYEAKSVEEICALELLRRHGARVGNRFTATELKTAWRKAALQTHPDRFTTADIATQARMSAAFRELCEAYDMLQATLETPLAA